MSYAKESVYPLSDTKVPTYNQKMISFYGLISNLRDEINKSDDNDPNQQELDIYRNKFIAFLEEGSDLDNDVFIQYRKNITNQQEFKTFLSNKKNLPLDFWSCPFGFKIFEQLYPYNKKN